MKLARYTPFRDFENFLDNWNWPQERADLGFVRNGDWLPSVDISETPKEFLIKAEIPEVPRDDVHVEVARIGSIKHTFWKTGKYASTPGPKTCIDQRSTSPI